ncbi:24494_t:CDS:2 [Gigaspora margarita]|uniref:24494_t:CDS:1 n=1 Tax=Gigaspora margarita TaxID=4874 RepID=A0ABN7ULV4_GIGMA|nr:24494_t:CDS:2 [Gigaspora margarita]
MVTRLKELVVHSEQALARGKRIKRERCEITITKEMVKAEEKNTLVRFLGIYFNSSLKEAMLVKKAKAITCQTVRALYNKKLTISQLIALQNPAALFKVFKKQDGLAKYDWKLHHHTQKHGQL